MLTDLTVTRMGWKTSLFDRNDKPGNFLSSWIFINCSVKRLFHGARWVFHILQILPLYGKHSLLYCQKWHSSIHKFRPGATLHHPAVQKSVTAHCSHVSVWQKVPRTSSTPLPTLNATSQFLMAQFMLLYSTSEVPKLWSPPPNERKIGGHSAWLKYFTYHRIT
jgi:hypothetical protein